MPKSPYAKILPPILILYKIKRKSDPHHTREQTSESKNQEKKECFWPLLSLGSLDLDW